MRGTEVAMTEGWWLLSRLPECSAPKTQTIALRLVGMLSLYTPYPVHKHNVCDITKWCHDHLLPSSEQEQHAAHAQEIQTGSPAQLACVPVWLFFLQLCMDHLINSISRILSLWHIYIYMTLSRNTGWIWWAHWGHDLSCMCYFAPKDCGLSLSSTGSDKHRMASYLADLQATKAQ